jgi:hypothetical protein
MSTVTQALLVVPVAMTGSDAAYYTAPVLTFAKVGRAVFCNTDTSAHALTMNLVAAGGSSGVSNTLISSRTLSPGESYVSPELAGLVITPGSMLRGLSATTVSITVSGITINQ